MRRPSALRTPWTLAGMPMPERMRVMRKYAMFGVADGRNRGARVLRDDICFPSRYVVLTMSLWWFNARIHVGRSAAISAPHGPKLSIVGSGNANTIPDHPSCGPSRTNRINSRGQSPSSSGDRAELNAGSIYKRYTGPLIMIRIFGVDVALSI